MSFLAIFNIEDDGFVTVTWTDDDEFKTFGKYKWKNGETKTIDNITEWHKVGAYFYDILFDNIDTNASYTGSRYGRPFQSQSFTSKDGVTVTFQDNDYLRVGEKVGTDEVAPPVRWEYGRLYT